MKNTGFAKYPVRANYISAPKFAEIGADLSFNSNGAASKAFSSQI